MEKGVPVQCHIALSTPALPSPKSQTINLHRITLTTLTDMPTLLLKISEMNENFCSVDGDSPKSPEGDFLWTRTCDTRLHKAPIPWHFVASRENMKNKDSWCYKKAQWETTVIDLSVRCDPRH